MIRQEKRRLDGPYEKQVTESWDTEAPQRGDIVYLHGGGLLFGTRDDLPAYHLEQLTRAGFRVLALDYPARTQRKAAADPGGYPVLRQHRGAAAVRALRPLERGLSVPARGSLRWSEPGAAGARQLLWIRVSDGRLVRSAERALQRLSARQRGTAAPPV